MLISGLASGEGKEGKEGKEAKKQRRQKRSVNNQPAERR